MARLGVVVQHTSCSEHPYYLCVKRGCASYGKSIRRDVLEGQFEELLKDMVPSTNLFKGGFAMFKKLWDHRLASSETRTRSLKTELAKIETQVEQFLDRIADATVPSVITAYENRIRKLDNERIVLVEKIASGSRPLKTFNESLRTALEFLANPSKLWETGHLEHKRMVLKLTFAERLTYVRNEGFRTTNLAWPFKALSHF